EFGDMLLTQITKKKIIKLLDKKAYDEDSPTQANCIKKRLNTMFIFAIKRDIHPVNIIASVPTYKSGNNKRTRFYSEFEIQSLWSCINTLREPTQSIFKMLLRTGQRKTETRLMQWKHIKNDVWIIPAKNA